MTAPEAEQIVQQWTPLALGIARRYGQRYPWLLDDFLSDAAYALWRAAVGHKPELGHIAGLVRLAVTRACWGRIRRERIHNPLAFRDQPNPDPDLDPITSLVTSREPDPAESAERTEAVADLPQLLSRLSDRERAVLLRHVAEGESLDTIANDLGMTRTRAGQIEARALSRLRLRGV